MGSPKDGPYGFEELSQGQRAAVLYQGSDELAIVDTVASGAQVRIPLERDPTDLALLDEGRLAIVHGRGESLLVVDPDSAQVLGRLDLGGYAQRVVPVPGSSEAWVYVSSPDHRELALVDTATFVALDRISLPVAAELYGAQPDVAFELEDGRAWALDPQSGQLLLIDLAARAVVAGASFAAGDAAQVIPGGGNGRATVISSRGEATSWLWNGTTLDQDWQYSCTTSNAFQQSTAEGHLTEDETRLFVSVPNGGSQGTCDGTVLVDVATGQLLQSNINQNWVNYKRVGPSDERIRFQSSGSSLFGLDVLLPADAGFESAVSLQSMEPSDTVTLERSEISGRVLGISVRSSSTELPQDFLTVVDPLSGRRTSTCDPAVPNATGTFARLEMEGSGLAATEVVARVRGLQPGGMFGYLLVSNVSIPPMPAALSQGLLCLGGSVGFLSAQVQPADQAGTHRFTVDFTELPSAMGTIAAQPGEQWSFQSWYRDRTPAGLPTSNFSTALSLMLR